MRHCVELFRKCARKERKLPVIATAVEEDGLKALQWRGKDLLGNGLILSLS